jgi:hypothetical protein
VLFFLPASFCFRYMRYPYQSNTAFLYTLCMPCHPSREIVVLELFVSSEHAGPFHKSIEGAARRMKRQTD